MSGEPISRFEWRSPVAWDELDMMGVLHHARFLLHVDRAISALLDEIGLHYSPDPAVRPDRHHAVVSLSARYRRPVTAPGEVRVRLTVMHLGRTSLTTAWSVESVHDGSVHADGERVAVHLGPDDRPAPWGQTVRDRLRPTEDGGRRP